MAVKEMKKRNDSANETECCRRELLHEAQILQSLGDHPNLPFLIGACTKIQLFCLVLQFYGIGEKNTPLHGALKKKLLRKKSTVLVFYEIAEALKYMHSKGVLHNDLRTCNVLMQRDTSDGEIHPILIDFGKSRSIAKAKAYKRGDVDYLRPEVKVGKKQSDIFSFGKILEAAVRGRSFLPIFSELITRTTALDPSDRPSAREVSHKLAKFLDE